MSRKHVIYKENNEGISVNREKFILLGLNDSMSREMYENQDKIYNYLMHSGEVNIATTAPQIDMFTGEVIESINPENGATRVDDVYSWPLTLPYYVKKYNVRLPKEFEDHILRKMDR